MFFLKHGVQSQKVTQNIFVIISIKLGVFSGHLLYIFFRNKFPKIMLTIPSQSNSLSALPAEFRSYFGNNFNACPNKK